MAFDQGPYLSAAFLCEKVLIEQDGVKSAIRIFDRTTRGAVGTPPPEQMEPFDFECVLFVRFKAGQVRGPRRLRTTLIKPSGESPPPQEQQIYFEGEDDRGVDIVGNMRIRVEMPGVYWFLLELEGTFLTRIPWRVIYAPMFIPQTSGGTAG